MKKHSIVISGHQTSLSLEPEFWEELKGIAAKEKISLAHLIEKIDNDTSLLALSKVIFSVP